MNSFIDVSRLGCNHPTRLCSVIYVGLLVTNGESEKMSTRRHRGRDGV
jgi:hypothetical protein